MANRKDKRRSGMILVMVSMALMLLAMGFLSSPGDKRVTQTLGWVIEKLKEQPTPRSFEEIRERWRLTRPGMLLSEAFIPKCKAPGLRALKADENGQPDSSPLQQASGSHTNP
jgi:hypothetical protein